MSITTREASLRSAVPWKQCTYCKGACFLSAKDFVAHLREHHCAKEGGSYVCRYGANNICLSLPLEGVSDRDYEDHVSKDHVSISSAKAHSPTAPARGHSVHDSDSEMSGHRSHGHSKSDTVSSPRSADRSAPDVPAGGREGWSIFSSRVNLAALLNDPRPGKREPDFFTKTWGAEFESIDPLLMSPLPVIEAEQFNDYIEKTSARLKRHAKNVENLPDPALPIDTFPILYTRAHDKAQSELSTVPKVFLQSTFNLENLELFNTVFPWSHVEASVATASPRTSSDRLLQEKLSHYLDIVEVQIARQVALKSEAFFHVMTSHEDLQQRLLITVDAVKRLRGKLQQLESDLVVCPLRVLKLKCREANLRTLIKKLGLIRTVYQTQPTIQLLLSANDFVGALDLIATTHDVLNHELSGVQSFRHLGSQLSELQRVIDTMMQQDFVIFVTSDLNRPVADGYGVVDEDRLAAIVMGMLRQQKFSFVDLYREEATTTIKAIIKQTVIEAVADVTCDRSDATIPDLMRQLDFSRWLLLLNSIFDNLLVILMRVKIICKAIADVVRVAAGMASNAASRELTPVIVDQADGSSASNLTSGMTLERRVSIVLSDHDVTQIVTRSCGERVIADLNEVVANVCDHAQERCTKVVAARGKDGSMERLAAQEYLQMSRCVGRFSSECEAICGRKSNPLRSCILSQASRFVNRLHEERKATLNSLLDAERWKAADVPCEVQELLDFLAGISSESSRIEENIGNVAKKRPLEYFIVGTERFPAVGSAVFLVKAVSDYCRLAADIPSAAADILSRLVETLKLFNARASQLVLGAGALQAAGLKTISTRNLALLARSLHLLIGVIPKLRSHFQAHLPEKLMHLLRHIDQVFKEYCDHATIVIAKMVDVMSELFDRCLEQWEVKAPVPSQCFRTLCKQSAKFHEALHEVLPENHIQEIFARINETLKQRLQKHLSKLQMSKDSGPQQGLVMAELAFYTENLKSLKGLNVAALQLTLADVTGGR